MPPATTRTPPGWRASGHAASCWACTRSPASFMGSRPSSWSDERGAATHRGGRRPLQRSGHAGRHPDRRHLPQRADAAGRRRHLPVPHHRGSRDPGGCGRPAVPSEAGVSAVETRAPILEARGLVKRYGVVTALNGADFDLFPGEILALIGDNGAGKSTLIKALSGAIVPDEGEILLGGTVVHFRNPLEARHSGIEAVSQDI